MLDIRSEDLKQQQMEKQRRVITVQESMTSEESGVSLWTYLQRMVTARALRKHNTLDLYNVAQHTAAPQVNNSGRQFSAYHIILGKRYKISPEVGSRSTVSNERSDDVEQRLLFWQRWPRLSALRNRCRPLVSQLQATAKQLHAALRRTMGRQSVDLPEAVAYDLRAVGDQMQMVRSIEEEETGQREEFRRNSRPLSVRRPDITNDNVYVSENSLGQTGTDLFRPHHFSLPTLSTAAMYESHREVVRYTLGGEAMEEAARTTSNPCHQITTAAIIHKEQFGMQLNRLKEDDRRRTRGPTRPRRLTRAVSFDDNEIRRTEKQTNDDDVVLRIRTLANSFTDQHMSHMQRHFLTIGRKKNRTRHFRGDDCVSEVERTYEMTEVTRDQRPVNFASSEEAVQEVGSRNFRKETSAIGINGSLIHDRVLPLESVEVSTGQARYDVGREKDSSNEVDKTMTDTDDATYQACIAPLSSYNGELDDKLAVEAATQSRSRTRNVIAVRSTDGSLENVYLSLLEITSVEDRNDESEVSIKKHI